MRAVYIGPQTTYHNLIPDISVELVPDQVYEIEIVQDGPVVRMNDQTILLNDGTLWVVIDNTIHIPYAPNLLEKQWRML